MFEKKKKLILASGILSLIVACTCLTLIPLYYFVIDFSRVYELLETYHYAYPNFLQILAISTGVIAVLNLVAGILLTIVGSTKSAEDFRKKRPTFVAGACFTVLSGILTIRSILVYIVCGMRNVQSFTAQGEKLYQQDVIMPNYGQPKQNVNLEQGQDLDQ